MNIKRIIVTGATGYIGSRLVRTLCAQGYEVHVLARSQSSLALLHEVVDSISVHRVAQDDKQMQEVFSVIKPHAIFHLASLFIGNHRLEQAVTLVESNLRFLVVLLELAMSVGCKYFINTGTAWQHYQGALYRPVNLYAATKEAAEKIIDYYVDAFELNVISLHLSDTYGPDDPRPKIIPTLIKLAKNGGSLNMSPGEQKVDFVYVDDVVNAYLIGLQRLVKSDAPQHEKFGISTGKTVSLRELVVCLERILSFSLNITWGGRTYREREVMHPTNLSPLPEWQPRVNLEQGLTQTYLARAC